MRKNKYNINVSAFRKIVTPAILFWREPNRLFSTLPQHQQSWIVHTKQHEVNIDHLPGNKGIHENEGLFDGWRLNFANFDRLTVKFWSFWRPLIKLWGAGNFPAAWIFFSSTFLLYEFFFRSLNEYFVRVAWRAWFFFHLVLICTSENSLLYFAPPPRKSFLIVRL